MQRALADIPSARIKPLVRDILHRKTASSSSASTDVPDTEAHVSDAGDEIMISIGTKRRRSVIHSDDEEENVDDENNTSISSFSINSAKSKVEIFVLYFMS